jgi:hypothetical protein
MSTNTTDTTAAEWGDSKRIEAIFGLGRTLQYELANAGLIQSVSLRRPGMEKAKRLFNIQSVRSYINGFVAKRKVA